MPTRMRFLGGICLLVLCCSLHFCEADNDIPFDDKDQIDPFLARSEHTVSTKMIEMLLHSNSSSIPENEPSDPLDLAVAASSGDPKFNVTAFFNYETDRFFREHFGLLGVNYYLENNSVPYILCKSFQRKECAEDKTKCFYDKKCYLDGVHRGLGLQHLGCVTVMKYVPEYYNNSIEKQKAYAPDIDFSGCWPHDGHVINECPVDDECLLHERKNKTTYCCCRTHLCNQPSNIYVTTDDYFHEQAARKALRVSKVDFTPELLEEAYQKSKDALAGRDNKDQQYDSAESTKTTIFTIGSWFSIVVLAVMLCALICILAGYAYKKQIYDPVKHRVTTEMHALTPEEAFHIKRKERLSKLAVHNMANITNMQKVAQGRFGEVFKADLLYESGEQSQVAVKKFHHSESESWFLETDIFLLPVFRRQSHQSIIRFIGVCMHEGPFLGQELWIVTEFHPLGSIFDYLRENILSLEQCLRILSTMLDGVAYLHEERNIGGDYKPTIVHRDLKTRNILLREDLSAVLTDFGLALRCDHGVMLGPDTNRQAQVGTSRYMAPEVLEGATEFSVSAFRQMDVYAGGLILWEVLSRTEAFAGESVLPYKMPYEEEAGKNPSLGRMRDVVVTQKIRPKHRKRIQEHITLRRVAETSEEMWDQEADGRITAGCALERIRQLYRDSGTVSEEDHPDEGSVNSNNCVPTEETTTASPPSHRTNSSIGSNTFNRAMSDYEALKAQAKNSPCAIEIEPLTHDSMQQQCV